MTKSRASCKGLPGRIQFFLGLLITLALSACGGGGGGGGTPPPTVPTGVTATPKDGYVLIDGQPVPGATTYNIYWSQNAGVSKANGTLLAVTSTPQAHTGLTNGTTYHYVVTAVGAGGEGAPSTEVTATPTAATAAVDPLFGDQWHLLNTSQVGVPGTPAGKAGEDINVQPAWNGGNKGAGVRVAVVDDGLEVGHEDLASNIAANGQSYNYVTGSSDPTNDLADTTSGHGTAVAGIVAARDLNGLGGSGVAPRATLVGYNLLLNQTLSNETDAMTRNAASVSVSSNSWGAPDGTGELTASPTTWQSAINTGLTTGRGGKGTVYTWAAGNGRAGSNACPTCFDDSNYDGRANYRGVMAVGAVNDQGLQSSYSESGANLWVAAPGGEFCNTHTITTTDRTGAVGENILGSTADPATGYIDYPDLNYTKCMNGTSSATPVVSGVVALMLAANSNLTWRDVRIILAQTARMNDPGTLNAGGTSTSTGWVLNGTGTSTALNPRYWFNHKYGFGVVDANAAVTAAKNWTNVVAEVTPYTTALTSANATIADTATTGVLGAATTSTMNVTTSPAISSIEWVEATVTITAAAGTVANSFYSGDFDITLTSPSGMVSQLAVPHICAADQFGACTSTYSGWVFGDAAHLGEAANGAWILTVRDGIKGGTPGKLVSWSLKFYGH